MPKTIVAGNWKMHKTAAETRSFFDAFLPRAASFGEQVTVVVAPPFTALEAAHACLRESTVFLGAQNVHWEMQGAFTGEVSVPMLREHGVEYVIVGHSERRAYCNELDRTVNLKVHTLLAHGMTPIVAVGETFQQREAGETDTHVIAQTRDALCGLAPEDVARVVLAYEPVWAIGTGRNCDVAEANRVMGAIRGCIPALEEVPILYGGSMKPENAAAYLAQPHVNGGLIGGASLDAIGFASLIESVVR